MSLTDALELAGQQLGMNERDQGAALQEYMANGGVNLDPATRAWCADYVNATLAQKGLPTTGSSMARSFLDWGQETQDPNEGDLAVFSRGDPNGPYGHVGFFKGYDEAGNVLVLGGNQGDAVSVAPYSKNNLLGFRTLGEESNYPQTGQAMPNRKAPVDPLAQKMNRLAMMQEMAPKGVQPLDPAAFMRPQNKLQFTPYTVQNRLSRGMA